MADMNLTNEDFYSGGPLLIVSRENRNWMPVVDDSNTWLDVNIWRNYFGPGYLRGDGMFFIACASWLEKNIAGAEVYYGHDVNDENISLFDETAREALLELERNTKPA